MRKGGLASKLLVFVMIVLLFSTVVSASTSLAGLSQASPANTSAELSVEITSEIKVNKNGSAIVDLEYYSPNGFNESAVREMAEYYQNMGIKILHIENSDRTIRITLVKENYATCRNGVWTITRDENINAYDILLQLVNTGHSILYVPRDIHLISKSNITLPKSGEFLAEQLDRVFYVGENSIKVSREVETNKAEITVNVILYQGTAFDVRNLLKILREVGTLNYVLNETERTYRDYYLSKESVGILQGIKTRGETGLEVASAQEVVLSNSSLSPYIGETGEVVLSNSNLSLYIAPDGNFMAYARDGRPITYPGYTSSLNVLVDDVIYGLRGTNSIYLGNYVTEGPVKVSETSAYIVYGLPGIVLNVTYTLDGPLIKFNYNVKNIDSRKHLVKLRILIDTQLGPNDGAPLYADGRWWTTEYLITHPIDKWMAVDFIDHPTLRTTGFLVTPTDQIIFAHWPSAIRSDFEYSWDPNRRFYTPGYTTSPASDSCVLQYYDLRWLHPNHDKGIVFYYGIGSLEDIEYPELEYTKRLTELLIDLSKGDAWSYAKASYHVAEVMILTLKDLAVKAVKLGVSLFVKQNVDEAMEIYRAFDLRHYPKAGWLKEFFRRIRGNTREVNVYLKGLDTAEHFTTGVSLAYETFSPVFYAPYLEELDKDLMKIYGEECQLGCNEQQVLDKMYETVLEHGGTNEINEILVQQESMFETSFHRGALPDNDVFKNRYFGTLDTVTSLVQEAVSEQRPQDYEFGDDPLPEYLYHVLPVKGTPLRYNEVYNGYYSTEVLYHKVERHEDWDWMLFIIGIVCGVLILVATGGTVAVFGVTLVSFSGTSTTTAAVLLGIGVAGESLTTLFSIGNDLWEVKDETALYSHYIKYGQNFITYYSKYSSVTAYEQIQRYVHKFISRYSSHPEQLMSLNGFIELDFEDTYSHDEPVSGEIYYENRGDVPANVTVILEVSKEEDGKLIPFAYFAYPYSAKLGETLGLDELGEISIEMEPFEYERYTLSLDLAPGKYIISADMYMNGVLIAYDSVVIEKNSWWRDLISSVSTVLTGNIRAGESLSTEYTPSCSTTEYITFFMEYPGSEINLHVYDKNGRHVGINYEEGRTDLDIPNATYYKSHGYELIRVPAEYGPYEVKVVGVDIIGQESVSVTAIEEPELPGIMAVTPDSLEINIYKSQSRTYPLVISEIGEQNDLHGVTISLSDNLKRIMHVSNTNIGDISEGLSVPVFLKITAPDVNKPTKISGTITISSEEGTIIVPVTVHVLIPENEKTTPTPTTPSSQNPLQLILTLSQLWTAWFFNYHEQFEELYQNATALGVDNETMQKALELHNNATELILEAWRKESLDEIKQVLWKPSEIKTVPQFWNIRKAYLLEREAVTLLQNELNKRE